MVLHQPRFFYKAEVFFDNFTPPAHSATSEVSSVSC
jgi:hypothetical protein